MPKFPLYLASGILLLICLANAFAFEKLGWKRNLSNTEPFFQQIFKVHTLFIVLTMLAMAVACFFAYDELLSAETLMAKGFLAFCSIFWGGRVILHLLYYDKQIKRDNPQWNALFLTAFIYLAGLFLTLTFF